MGDSKEVSDLVEVWADIWGTQVVALHEGVVREEVIGGTGS